MRKEMLEKSMGKLYEKLYQDVQQSVELSSNAHFVSIQGSYYQQNTRRLMLIGRAPNGWGQLDFESPEAFGNEAQNQFDDLTRWNWIKPKGGALYNSGNYCISQKPFWAYTKAVWKNLPGEVQNCDVWMNNITWSNLYKISPLQGNNPNQHLVKLQQPVCKAILQTELDIYQPTHILICTGYDWFAPFSDIFTEVIDTGKRNVMRGKNQNTVYVEGTAYFQDAKVVITCRPEYRDKAGFINAVSNTFAKQ